MDHQHGSESAAREGLFNLTRQMENEDEDQFDVDVTIMDFLAYKAINLIFEWRSSINPYVSDLPSALASMTAEFRTFVKHKHGGRRLNTQAAFRSRLLQFSLLFSHRLNHDNTWTTEQSLNHLRAQNRNRGSYWRLHTHHSPALAQPFDPSSQFPLADGALAENRHQLACSLGQPKDKRRWVTDLEGTPSLHCLLSLFIELTAARVDLGDWDPSDGWMHLVGQFMLQAVTEEYLRNGAYGEESFNAIFAFGYPGTRRRPDDGPDIQAMRTVFCAEGNTREQIPGWSEIKQHYINELLPQRKDGTSFLGSISLAQERHTYIEFENQMLSFLEYLHKGLTKPDLVQVEEGRITIHGNDLGEAESREMIRRMGL
ncbi:hypothetical protein DM02DRAFT_658988 [Periconia macrospinosa]|uniref:Uncharacterized protein n=1 Tax=Periconia macrospinosa TaxID=97972 RepID=A0A2V1DF30_9PLEO|nr:hypothetical protein DM02DRAFT_658988 [Periconia macrospinosa]